MLADLSVSRRSRVPVRRQLTAQLGAVLRSGSLRPGARLPSERRLAAYLHIHRNTVAAVYSDLERLHLVRRTPGRGTYVRSAAPRSSPDSEHGEAGLAGGFAAFLERQRELGRTAEELDGLLGRWSARSVEPRLAVIEPDEGLRRLFVAEISSALPGVDVFGWTPADACRQPVGGVCLVARPDVLGRIRVPDPSLSDMHVLRTAGAQRWQCAVGSLRSGDVLTLLTVSRCLRNHAAELLASVLSDRIGFARPVPDRTGEVARAIRVASLILADSLCAATLDSDSHPVFGKSRPPLRVVRVTSATWLGGLARYLGIEGRAVRQNAVSRNLNAHEA